MQQYSLVAIVTLLSLLVYMWMVTRVGGARRKTGIAAPAMPGDPHLERNIRVHYNTLEALPVYLSSLWLFALYWDPKMAAGAGLVWIVGRILYATGYVADPGKRELGFMIQLIGTAFLLFGSLGKIIYDLVLAGGIV